MLTDLLGGGTGFVVEAPSGKHYVLTNRHVCDSARIFIGEDFMAMLSLVEAANWTDLCLLTAPSFLYNQAIEVSDTDLQPHDEVHILGYGMLIGLTRSDGYYVGRIMDQVLSVVMPGYVTATVLPGNSGSPVLNSKGKLVGVVYASGGEIDNRALIVPLEDIKDFLSKY